MKCIRFIHWNPSERNERAAILQAAGYDVVSHLPPAPMLLKELRSKQPDAVVIDLSRLPSQGRDLGILLRKSAATRMLPLIFVDGDPEKVGQIRALLPDAAYASWKSIRSSLRSAIAHPPDAPLVPASVFESYKGVSLTKKLGIKPQTIVALVNAPVGFKKKIRPLPVNVSFVDRVTPGADLTIWFNTSEQNLNSGFGKMLMSLGNGRLWIAWPKKGRANATDLTQAVVRKKGLGAGLVDYKICSIDATWSGLLFTPRK